MFKFLKTEIVFSVMRQRYQNKPDIALIHTPKEILIFELKRNEQTKPRRD